MILDVPDIIRRATGGQPLTAAEVAQLHAWELNALNLVAVAAEAAGNVVYQFFSVHTVSFANFPLIPLLTQLAFVFVFSLLSGALKVLGLSADPALQPLQPLIAQASMQAQAQLTAYEDGSKGPLSGLQVDSGAQPTQGTPTVHHV